MNSYKAYKLSLSYKPQDVLPPWCLEVGSTCFQITPAHRLMLEKAPVEFQYIVTNSASFQVWYYDYTLGFIDSVGQVYRPLQGGREILTVHKATYVKKKRTRIRIPEMHSLSDLQQWNKCVPYAFCSGLNLSWFIIPTIFYNVIWGVAFVSCVALADLIPFKRTCHSGCICVYVRLRQSFAHFDVGCGIRYDNGCQ